MNKIYDNFVNNKKTNNVNREKLSYISQKTDKRL